MEIIFSSPLTLSCPLESDVHDWEDASLILEGTGLVTLDHWKSMDSDRKNTTSKSRRLLRSKYTEMSCSLVIFNINDYFSSCALNY